MYAKLRGMKRYLALLSLLVVQGFSSTTADAQTFSATRVDGRPSTPEFDPIIDESNFAAVNTDSNSNAASVGGNINGPSIIRVPDWIPISERVHPSAQYYLYFGNHRGDDIRMAWSDSLTGTWTLFNVSGGSGPLNNDRAWGVNGNNTGTQTPLHGVLTMVGNRIISLTNSDFLVSDHVASPEVIVDNVNQRLVMNIHGTTQFLAQPGQGTGQRSFVTTSKYGLDFNPANGLAGPELHGLRDVVTARAYVRSFQVGGRTFAYTNGGDLWRAPAFNDAGEVNTIANADSEGGLWNPSGVNTTAAWWEMISASQNPLSVLYETNGQSSGDPRHSGTYTRTHIDPNDTNVYLFYTARDDTPERIFLTVIDTNNGSTEPSEWTTIGQRVILQAELDWEGGDLPPTTSVNGAQINVNQLRDPLIFEDDQGTQDPSDDKLYMFYTGEGEEAIGFAELTFDPNSSNLTGPQGDLIDSLPEPTPEPTPLGDIVIAAYDFGTVTETNNDPSGVAADMVAPGITSTITDDPDDPILRRLQSNIGSDDGTFGDGMTFNTMLGMPAVGGRLQFFNGNNNSSTGVDDANDAVVFLNITNGTADPLTFDELLFDFGVQDSQANNADTDTITHDEYSVTFENITTSTTSDVLGSASELAVGFHDVNIDLTGSGIVLGAGEEGRFVISVLSGGELSNSSGVFDNVAITGQFGEVDEIIKGDVNMDGIINFLDISPFILALSSPGGAPAEADCNCDGIVNFLDISPFILKLAGGS